MPPAPPAAGSRRVWGVALAAGLTGALVVAAVVATTGGFATRVVERQVIERQAVQPVAAATNPLGRADGVVQIADAVAPAVVRLDVEAPAGAGRGSGIVFRDNGYLLTNGHVVDGAVAITVVLADGRELPGSVVGSDALTDVAVVKVDAEGLVTAPLGSADGLEVGETAIAIGSPLGLAGGPSVTVGVVSALGRRVATTVGPTFYDMIQTDAPIAPGSSGGALLDGTGAVIGITTAVAVADAGVEAFGFATPIDVARTVADDLIASGRAHHVWLGIGGTDLTAERAAALQTPGGVAIEEITAGGPAEAAGLLVGDVIVGIATDPVRTMGELVAALRHHRPGVTVDVTLRRGSDALNLAVVLGERPTGAS
ncbi:MAG: trypsin-like peptidase domain-containing protein [Acidimicrobiales bacterium]|nr:trypsin-like peptidase domain-containing protein [Acidimicrobiales bacterium]